MDDHTLDQSLTDPAKLAIGTVQDEGTSLDLRVLFDLLQEGKSKIVLTTVMCTAVAVLISFLLPTKYTSSASFIPPGLTSNSSSAMLAGQLAGMGMGDLLGAGKGAGELYASILESRSIASEIVARFNLKQLYKVNKESAAEQKLEAAISVKVDPKSGIVNLDVTDQSPSRARDLADALLDALREKNGSLALSQASQRRLFFEQQLAKEKDALENAEVELKKTEEQSGLIAPVGQTETELRSIADTQAEIAARQVQLAALRQSATDQNPDVIRLQSEISDLEGQLARMQNGSRNSQNGSIPTSKVPELQLDYVRREREVKYHEALFEILSKQYEAARLDEAREAPVLQVLDPASFPDTRSSPKRTVIAICGMFIGLIAGCVWVLIPRFAAKEG